MNIHSKFIIHWTGKEFFNPGEISKLTEEQSSNFLKRLKDIVQHGLLMGKGDEKVYGKKNKWIKIIIPKVCFTEVKLSQTMKHAQEYGPLGVGFNREFILSRYGNPACYVQNGENGIIVENLDLIHKFIMEERDAEMLKNLEVVLGFIKNMSDRDVKELKYYDEMEWRIIHSDLLEEQDKIIKYKNNLYLRIDLVDIKIIIFPNDELKKMALEDDWLKENLFSKITPVVATYFDCMSF